MVRIIALLTAVVFFSLQLLGGTVSVLAGDKGQGTGSLPALVSDNNEFAFAMYKRIGTNEQDKNLFFSPLSISTAMGMTYAGARGNTERQMAEVLHFHLPQDELHAAFGTIAEKLKGTAAKGYQLNIANALWGQKDYPFEADFLRLIKKRYEGGFNIVDFAADTENSRELINQWVEKNTADKIKNLLQPDDLTSLTRLVLTNAIYFKGDWATQFKKEQTRPAPFSIRPDETTEVQMMHQKGTFGYVDDNGVQVLELSYVGGALSMVVLLPQSGIEEFGANLTPDQLNRWLANMQSREVNVFLPKFKFEARYGLGGMLSQMGMADAFDLPPADFSGMTGGKQLYISKIIHQAVIEVNEEGSEAAAATAVVMGTKSVAHELAFKADRPFIFLIQHKETGAILFMGKVANPAGK